MIRLTTMAVAGLVWASLMCGGAAAQEIATVPANGPLEADALALEPSETPQVAAPFPAGMIDVLPPRRPSILPVLYGSLIALEAYDGYSTMTGTAAGATETNPLLRGVTDNPYAMWAIKGGATIVGIYVAERLWKQHHRGAAVATMIVFNGLMAGVAARNVSVKRTPVAAR